MSFMGRIDGMDWIDGLDRWNRQCSPIIDDAVASFSTGVLGVKTRKSMIDKRSVTVVRRNSRAENGRLSAHAKEQDPDSHGSL